MSDRWELVDCADVMTGNIIQPLIIDSHMALELARTCMHPYNAAWQPLFMLCAWH
jgi:hypothetical protein